MSFPYLDNVNFNQQQILNAVIQNLGTAPGSTKLGQFYFDTINNVPFFWNGTSWANPFARSFHTGTQTASTISDLSTVVHAYTLDGFAAPAANVNLNNQKITNLANGTAAGDAVNYGQLTAQVASWQYKPDADAVTTTTLPVYTYSNGASGVGATITFNSVGTVTIDTRVLLLNDVVLVNNESGGNAPNNGLYLVTTAPTAGVAGILTRHTSMNTPAQFKGAVSIATVTSAANAGGLFLCSQTNPTIGTTGISFNNINPSFSYIADETSIHLTGLTFGIKSTWAGQAAITTVGAITTGSWTATPVGIPYGGHGQATASAGFNALSPVTTLGDIIFGSAANTNSRLAGNTTAVKQYISQTGTGSVSAAPVWAQIAFGDISGTLGYSQGGTNATTAAAAFNNLSPNTTLGDIIYGSGTNTNARLAGNITSAKQFLNQTGNGSI